MTIVEIEAAIAVLDAAANTGLLEVSTTVDGIQRTERYRSLADLRSRISELRAQLASLTSLTPVTRVRRVAFAISSGIG